LPTVAAPLPKAIWTDRNRRCDRDRRHRSPG